VRLSKVSCMPGWTLSTGRLLVAFLFICLLLTSVAAGQEPPTKDGRYFEAMARKAYEAKDYFAFLENQRRAAELRPNHPRIMYNLAIAYALNGKSDEALKSLRTVADM